MTEREQAHLQELADRSDDVIRRGPLPSRLLAVALSALSGAAASMLVAIRWTGVIDEKLAQNAQAIINYNARLEYIDANGTRPVPMLQERVNTLIRTDDNLHSQIIAVSNRLDDIIRQINRLDTPLSKKVEGIENLVSLMRDRDMVGFEDIAALKQPLSDQRHRYTTLILC